MSIGERIKQIRGKESQKEFAKAIGVAQNTLGNYERNERTPNADVIIKIADHCEVSFDWLLLGKKKDQCDDVIKLDKGELCSHCKVLEAELTEERKLVRELVTDNRGLMKENRDLMSENGNLRVELERIKSRAAPNQEAPNEAHRKTG